MITFSAADGGGTQLTTTSQIKPVEPMLKRVQFSPTGGSGNTDKITNINEYMLENILHVIAKLSERRVGMHIYIY